MPLNTEDSYNELTKYRQFYCSVHSAYQFSYENFIKVPPKTIIVTTSNDNSVSSYDQIGLYFDLVDIKNYLVKILLTENDDIPEYHKFHNKTIYMPGSCIPNIGIQFAKIDEKDSNILGIFDINKNIWNNDEYDEITKNDKLTINRQKFNSASIVPAIFSNNRNLYFKDTIKIIHELNPDEYGYIIFIDGCTDIMDDSYVNFLSKKDLNVIRKNSIEKNQLDLSTEYTKYNQQCVLDSLQKFTGKFTFYDKTPIDFSQYIKYKKNFIPNEIYIKKYKQQNKDVNKYFSKLSDIQEESENDIYYNKSGESVGTLGMMSMSKSESKPASKSKPDVFGRYLNKEIQQILSPRRSSRLRKNPKSSPRKIQPLRRSSRIASARKMYDGKRRLSSKRISKRNSRVITLQKSSSPNKKYMAKIDNKTVHFGAKGYSDFTKHRDKERKKRYISRHRKRENWTKSGLKTAGFWSFWLLWNKPSFTGSIKDTERRFGIKIKRK
jgi:hypothetical protein